MNFDQNYRLNLRALAHLTTDATRSRMRRLLGFITAEALVWLFISLAAGSFLYHHRATAHLALAAALVLIYSNALLGAALRQGALIGQLDYSAPVASLQRQLETLRIERIRVTKWAILIGIALWAPASMVLVRALTPFDLYTAFGPAWMFANAALGLALIPAALILAKRYQGDSPWLQKLARSLAGRDLNEALSALGELDEFTAA